MGCHTWFSRPVTEEEYAVFRTHALDDAWYYYGDTDENRKLGLVDMNLYHKLKDSIENDTDFWRVYGLPNYIGTRHGDKSEYVYLVHGVPHLDLAEHGEYNIFPNLKRFHDEFRVENYPSKIIHSRRQLRRWMGKKYFELSEQQLERVSEFFRTYPNGVIRFG